MANFLISILELYFINVLLLFMAKFVMIQSFSLLLGGGLQANSLKNIYNLLYM